MEIKITCRESIKPSLPTPQEHKKHKLCLFDVYQLNTYFPLILFYHKGSSDILTQLKKSLSEALTIFYPLAGRKSSDDPFSINCNDEGAIYIESTIVNITIEEFLNPPKLELLNELLPCEPNKTHPNHEVLPQLVIQANTFKCGGIAVAMCNLHTLLDASSCITFLKTWFAISRGSAEEISFPNFSSAPSLFPPRVNTSGLMRSGVLNLGRDIEIETLCTTRRFLFDFKAMNELISKAALGNNGRMMNTNPTRYQAVSSFICKHMIMSCMKEEDKNRPVVVLHVVDMRRRMGEPFTQNSIGNLLWPAVMLCENVNKDTEISELVKVSKGGIGKVTKELLVRVQKDEGFWWSDECGKLMLEEVVNKDPVSFLFTSWCDMGFKELDFGLGKPLWLAQKGGNSETIPNTVVFMDTKDGMEAWISMRPQHIATLENDVDFLKFALLNPTGSILLNNIHLFMVK
ncbi:hypothetical protein HN51_009701 [Arachis hypogaea]|uniref:epi-neemfruitin B 7-O-acetyltransferse L7AT n=1 Tax=Arachis hypogaea TaxID=3818 RepID=UPI000DEC0C8F|nr:vinorine synthase [Arachis hypogaea]QHO44232.1 Vinorine synthase [Arachis hypogaea]